MPFHESPLSEAGVLRLFKRRGRLKPEEIEAMLGWSHGGGSSVDAQVRIEANDRRGLEQLLRYCARPAFALDRLAWIGENHQRLVYRLALVPCRTGAPNSS